MSEYTIEGDETMRWDVIASVPEPMPPNHEVGWKCDCEDCDTDAFELEPTGQLSIGVDGEQRAIPGLAPEGKPAPLNFERDATETAAREEELGLWRDCCKARSRHRLDCPEYRPIGFIDERMPG